MPAYNHLSIKVNGTALTETEMNAAVHIVVDSALYLPDTFTIEMLDNELKYVDDKRFVPGAEMEIGVTIDEGATQEKQPVLIKGVLTSVEVDFNDRAEAVLCLRGYDKSYKLSQGVKTRTFAQKTDADIISTVAVECGLSVVKDSTSDKRDVVFQYNQTNWEFLVTLARRNGFVIYTDDTQIHFKKPTTSLRGAKTELGWGYNLIDFQPRLVPLGQISKSEVRGWDRKAKTAVTSSKTTPASATVSRAIGFSDTGAKTIKTLNSETIERIVDHPVRVISQADALAQAVIDNEEAKFIQAEGRCDSQPKLKAGSIVTVKKVGMRFSGDYFLSRVRHVYQKGVYEVFFSATGYQAETIHSLLMPGSDQPVPGGVGGVVTAIVTNVNDPDKMGRVKLKYPWLDENLESDWAPTAILGGGIDRGVSFIPEVNDEVLVAFDHGDINVPFVIGGLWNGKDTMSTLVTVNGGKVEKRVIRSRTGLTIIMDDTNAKGVITIKDKDGENTIILDQENGAISLKCKKDMTIEAGGKLTIKATGDISMSSDAGAAVTTGQNFEVTSKAGLTMKANTQAQITGTAGTTIKGAKVDVTADTMASVKGSAMVEIQGGIVKIN